LLSMTAFTWLPTSLACAACPSSPVSCPVLHLVLARREQLRGMICRSVVWRSPTYALRACRRGGHHAQHPCRCKGGLSHHLVRGLALPSPAFTWSASLASLIPCAPPVAQAASDRESRLTGCPTTPDQDLQPLTGRSIGELDCEDYELRSQQEPAAAEAASTPLSRCVSDTAPGTC